jgi:hypothetical protein
MDLYTLTPSREQRAGLVRNILAVYYRGTSAQYAQGMSWYQTAHDLALLVGKGDPVAGAGVIAALSANTGWGQNRKMAIALSETGEAKGLPLALRKAERILAGVNPELVLGNGRKTRSFFHNIAHPATSQAVTVDRHAYDIAVGQVNGKDRRGLDVGKRYGIFEEAYREAAREVGILPSQLQAVTWVVWREEIENTSTRGSRKD